MSKAILIWCRAKCREAAEPNLQEAIRLKMSKYLDYIKWDNMSGLHFLPPLAFYTYNIFPTYFQ